VIFLILLTDTIEIKLKQRIKLKDTFALKELANYYLKKQDYKKALKLLEKYIKYIDDSSAYDLIIRIHGTLKNLKGGYNWSKKAYFKFPNNITFLKYQAIFLDNMDKVEEAYSIFKKLYEMDTSNLENLVNYGIILYRKKDYDKALIYLKKADSILSNFEIKGSIDVFLKNQELHYRVLAALSSIYSKKEDKENAILAGVRAYIYSLKEKKEFNKFLVSMLFTYKEYERVIEICEDLLKNYPDEDYCWKYKGFSYFKIAEKEKQDSFYSKVIENLQMANSISYSVENDFFIAYSYYKLKMKERAYKIIDKILDFNDDYKILKIYWLIEDKDYEKAKNLALSVKSKKPSFFLALAKLFENENKLKLAEKYYKLAIQYDKDNLTRYRELSNFYKKIGFPKKSKEILIEYTKRKPKDYLAYFELAEEYNKEGDFQKAQHYYEETIKIIQEIIDTTTDKQFIIFVSIVYNNYGYMLVNENIDLEKGFDLIRQAISLNPNDPSILDSYGWALFKKGEYEEAFKYIKQAYEKKPDDNEIRNHYEIIKKILNLE